MTPIATIALLKRMMVELKFIDFYSKSYTMSFMAKVMISIPGDLLRSIDRLAKAEHRKRSEFFKELALRYLDFKRRSKREFADLEGATSTGLSFWDNPTDDQIWNVS